VPVRAARTLEVDAARWTAEDDPPIPAPDFDPREPPSDAIVTEEREYDCECEYVADEPWTLFPQGGLLDIHGWVAAGVAFNARKTTAKFNGPVTFNDRRDEVMLNQLYTVIERRMDSECCFDVGGRVDLLFGTDYVFTQTAGLETNSDFSPRWNSNRFYGLAMPQMYLEAGYGDLAIKVGHFYTIIGYEVVTAPDNFFYSHAYTMQYGEPFTHTGVLATWSHCDNWTFTGGVVDGWDKFDPVISRAAFLGGAAYTPDHEQYSIAFAIVSGDEDGAAPPIVGNRTTYSIVFSRDVTERLHYVIQHDHGIQSLGGGATEEWYGINQYLFYTINDCWKAGLRVEWFRDDDGVRVASVRPGNNTTPGGHSGNFYEITAGLKWTPTANLTVRPEVRWDWFSGENATTGPMDGRSSQFTSAVDVILTF